ncbi:MAG: hypothetical protein KGZ81_13885 [Flavobacteriales bacterium]|nr:hypothetical protein [Flavobacteriales bacterium]
MYTYKRAVGINQLVPEGQEIVDISALQTKALPITFSELIIVVTDSLYNRDVSIDMLDYVNELISFTGTIQQWLDTKATVVLKTSNTLPGTEYRWATLHDIQYKWFTLYPGDAGMAMDRQEHLDIASAKDIRVYKTDNSAVDYTALAERCLWTFNGHLTRAVADKTGLYLLNAGKNFRINDNCHACCINLNTMTKLKTYGFKPEDVIFENADTHIFVHLKTPVSLLNKTVWMSIGGRLYLNDVINMVSEKMLAIRTERVDWFTRIFDSKRFIDLEGVIDKDREVVGKDFFSTEKFWKALLSHPSTFLIVADNPHLYVSLDPVQAYKSPFTYETRETKALPLLTADGMLPKYFTYRIINRRILNTDLGNQRLYLNWTTGTGNGGDLHHGYTNRFKPSKLNTAYLLSIRSVIQEN